MYDVWADGGDHLSEDLFIKPVLHEGNKLPGDPG
jgi:hypothetical protein